MNKVFKTALTALLAFSVSVPVFAAPDGYSGRFTDIGTEDFAWAKPYINEMAARGLISGYEDGTYRPDNDITHLEGLSLFARAMGSNDSTNADMLAMAHEKYDSIINSYGLGWGCDEIAYLMYKGALKRSDLDTYLKDNLKDEPMLRYEAAIIITKAMGGEAEALSDYGVVLNYDDARDVPSNAIQYVSYASEKGIMEGMGDGTFSPLTYVKRSQMAVMLSRTVEKTDYSFVYVKISDVDTASRTVTVTDMSGKSTDYAYSDSTVMRSTGDEVQPKNLPSNVDAVITLSGRNLVSVDTLYSQPDETIQGKYVSYSTSSGRTTIRIIPYGETASQGYECASNLSVTYEGSPATIRSFVKDDVITLNLVNGKVRSITAETKTTSVSGAVVERVNVGEQITITISHGKDEYNGKTYPVSSDVSVKKNDAPCGLDEIYKGDKINLTLEYGTITKITATSNKKVVEGSIQGLTISSRPTMDVKVNGTVSTYEITGDIDITINGEEGTLYDFRVGDVVKLTLESDAITKIVASSTQESAGSITGVVTAVNESYGVISVQKAGSETSEQVMCKEATFIDVGGKTRRMKDIKVGQTVDVRGSISNGVFVGKLIVIVSEE